MNATETAATQTEEPPARPGLPGVLSKLAILLILCNLYALICLTLTGAHAREVLTEVGGEWPDHFESIFRASRFLARTTSGHLFYGVLLFVCICLLLAPLSPKAQSRMSWLIFGGFIFAITATLISVTITLSAFATQS